MKVLHVNQYLAPKGGAEMYVLSLLSLLEERGIDQQFVYETGDTSHFPAALQVPGVGQPGFRKQGDLRRRVLSVLQRERPDVVHVHAIQNIGALQACLDYGPTILTTHDYRYICPASLLYYKRTLEVCPRHCGPGCFTTTITKHCLTPRPHYAAYYYYRAKWVIDHAAAFAHVTTPSTSVKDRLVPAGFDADRITVLPYFCPLEPLEVPRPMPEEITLTFMGRLTDYKGYDVFIRALGLLPDHMRGVVVGDVNAESEARIRDLARAAGCAHRLRLRNWAARSEIAEIYDGTTLFIFPTRVPETLGIVGLEAMARGVPVVASDIGGVREWLRDRQNGVLVQPKSAEQIRDAVLELTADRDRLLAYGKAGIATIKEKFLPAQHVDTLLRIYENVA